MKKVFKLVIIIVMVGAVAAGGIWFLQAVWAHREGCFGSPESCCGAGYECRPLIGWIVREDLRAGESGQRGDDETTSQIETAGPAPADPAAAGDFQQILASARAGDILITFSTHTLGWRHGHAALVIDGERTVECGLLGEKVGTGKIKRWEEYSCVYLLRVKDAGEEERVETADFVREEMVGVPYKLTAGLLGKKDPEMDQAGFGVQCAYLIWYAWLKAGYDLDSDGGRLVTPMDIFQSDHLEVIAAYR